MKIVGKYSFNNGENAVHAKYPRLFSEVEQAINNVDARRCKIKKAKKKRCRGKCSIVL